ncbi:MULTISPECIES: EVE domain-containing protein [Legionella]|uniref:EVE domain-containing protein n=1 Tax=Legionella TaxID=445 RepID=UPI0018F6E840|nr:MULTISPECIES: EVE domain-containing protein [Legionella]MCP0913670.1 EVE domain-containing protein [Legionella sp. 27cVA30]
MKRNWLAVAAAEHVRVGRQLGFMQVCHGKKAPLLRLHPHDWVVYYSPTVTFRGKDKLQSFTAIGSVKPGVPYQVDMGNGFCPFRRDVLWFDAQETFIAPLLNQLDFTQGKKNWGYPFRFGLFELSEHDMQQIAQAMQHNHKTQGE